MPQFEPGKTKIAKITMSNPTTKAFDYTGFVYMGTDLVVMSEASFSLNAGEEKLVSFPVNMPTAPGTYPVHIGVFSNGQSIGLYKATEDVAIVSVGVGITSITLSKAIMVQGDPFTFALAFSNPHDYDIWVSPSFGFGLLTGEPLRIVEEGNGRPELIVEGFDSEAVLAGLGWNGYLTPMMTYKMDWIDLGMVGLMGSNMTNLVYDPDGVPLTSGSTAYLKVPAGGQASTSKQWYISSRARTERISGPYYVYYQPLPPIDLDACVRVNKAFRLEYYPDGTGGEWEGNLIRYRMVDCAPLLSVVPNMVRI